MREERAMATVRMEATDRKWKLLIALGVLIAIVGAVALPGYQPEVPNAIVTVLAHVLFFGGCAVAFVGAVAAWITSG
jgi:hypothetical protein